MIIVSLNLEAPNATQLNNFLVEFSDNGFEKVSFREKK